MTDGAYSRGDFVIQLGVSLFEPKRCGIYITDKMSNSLLFKPHCDMAYVTHRIYLFTAIKKIACVAIIGNLQHTGIVPQHGFKCHYYPDYKYYVDLPYDLDKIDCVLVTTLTGLSIDKDCNESFTIIESSQHQRDEVIKKATYALHSLDQNMALICDVRNGSLKKYRF